MGNNITEERQQAHPLLDMLPQEKLTAVRSLLEVMVEPLTRSLASAPVEEEEVTPETAAALDASSEWLKHNAGIPHEEVLAELGITQEEVARYNKAR